ncbi:MAG: hypothetical protein ABI647_24155 [Gemmatimonadota bacterium]
MSADQPRDWDKELAQIDKLMGKPGAAPAQLPAPAGKGAPRPALPAPAAAVSRRETLTTWARVALGIALAAGMTQWPYFHACGWELYGYLAAIGVTTLAGLWGATASWRRRMGLAHTLSLLVMLAGGILAAREVLPRIGYTKYSAIWMCK